MALNPSSTNQPKDQSPKSGGGGEKSARISAPPALSPSGPNPAEPQRLGKYEIQKKLGSGGMGTVYLAMDTQLRRQVALKVLPKEKAENPQLVRRFQSEAQSAANLRHENIVTVYEAGQADGYLFMALEYVDGIDTAELITRRGVVPFKRSIEIVRHVLKALDHAFSKSIVHRDIKPANLMIRRDGMVKLTDLGLARSREDPVESGITRAGTTVGTIDYMSPEQAKDSKSADVRSDIYSLGCTWYFLLTGQPPYPEGNLTNKLQAHHNIPFPDPRLITPGVPEGVVAIMRRMTEKDPQRRYQTPADVLADLDQSSTSRSMSPELALNELAKEQDDDSGSAVRRNSRSATAMPALDLPPARSKGKSKGTAIEEPTPQRDYRLFFYGIVAVGAVAILGAVGWIIKSYSNVWDTPHTVVTEVALSNNKAIQRPVTPTENRSPKQNPTESSPEPTRSAPTNQNHQPETTQSTPPSSENSGNQPAPKSADPKKPPAKSPVTDSPPISLPVPGTLAIPAWVREPRPVTLDRVITVRSNPRLKTDAATLHAALASVPGVSADAPPAAAGVGTVIELEGPGPFLFRPSDVQNKSRVIVRARGENGGSATQPLVILLPPETGPSPHALLRCEGTQVELRGIHFALAVTAFNSPLDSLITVRNGSLFVERCTFTVPGAPATSSGSGRSQPGSAAASPLTALRVLAETDQSSAAMAAGPSKILIDDCVFRGPALTALSTETSHADIIIRNTLAWAGAVPAMRLEAPLGNANSKSRIIAGLSRSTLVSQTCGIELPRNVVDGPSGPLKHAIAIGISDSLIAAPAGSERPALCSLTGWSRVTARAACGKLLTWQSIRSLYLGWNRLIDLPTEGSALASTFNDWQSFFEAQPAQRQPFGEGGQFQRPGWPAKLPGEFAAFDPASLAAPGSPIEKPATGGWPGAAPRDILLSDITALLASARHLLPRPKFPDFFVSNQADLYPVHVNLNRDDLGKVLENMTLRTGMTIIASGSDRHLCTPFIIKGVWIRIKFEQVDGPPLILTPRGPTYLPPGSDDAFISVRNGGLELNHAVFEAPADEQKPIPKWFLQGLNGDLILRNCRIAGPMVGTRNLGVVQWLRTGYGTPNRPPEFPQDPEALLVLQDTWLSGGGTVVQADLPHRALFARNSMLVARDTLFELRVGGSASGNPGEAIPDPTIDLEHCTLSAAGRVFQFSGATFPLRTFADRCVFAPPLKVKGNTAGPVLLSCSTPTLDQRQVRWWEAYCGYAPELTRFVQLGSGGGQSAASPSDFTTDWERRWGTLFVNSPLSRSGGVVLAGNLPEPRKITPADFQLAPTSLAQTWAPFENPIGAVLKAMKLPEARPVKSSGTDSNGNSGTSKPPPARVPPVKKVPPKVDTGF